MYKKIIISTSLASVILFSGCGSQTPSEAILKTIENKNIAGEKNISNLIYDFYNRTKNNIHKSSCSNLSTTSDNLLDKTIIELSLKYCGKDKELENKMKSILNNINKNKSMSITFDKIDGTL
jgi:hypothetical protein